MKRFGQSLDKIVDKATQLKQVRKKELRFGDLLLIATQNSVYSIRVLDNGFYLVSGGWFDRKALSPYRTTITGCTWGGSVIKLEIVAACGLCLEFGNRVVTTPIRQLCVIRSGALN
jgi:hypothetical protein